MFWPSKQQLQETQKKYDEAIQQLEEARQQLEETQKKYDEAIQQLNNLTNKAKQDREKREMFLPINTKENYDVVINIPSLTSLASSGWKLTFGTPEIKAKFKAGVKWDYSVVAMMGYYNSGKTFFVNKLVGSQFASGSTTSTVGLSFKLIDTDTTKHILLDSAGLEQPIPHANLDNKSDDPPIAQHYYLDYFLQESVLLLGDFFIMIVNDIRATEQENILRLADNVAGQKKDRINREVFVIHNWKNIKNMDEAKILWQQQVINNFASTDVAERKKQCGILKVEGTDFSVECFQTEKTRHLFYLCDESENEEVKNHNAGVILLLRIWLKYARRTSSRDIVSLFMQNTQQILPQYIKEKLDKIEIDWQDKKEGEQALVNDIEAKQALVNDTEAIIRVNSEKKLQLSAYTTHPFMGIIPVSNNIPVLQYDCSKKEKETHEVVVVVPGCRVSPTVDITTRTILLKLKRNPFIANVPTDLVPVPANEEQVKITIPIKFHFPANTDELILEKNNFWKKEDGVIFITLPAQISCEKTNNTYI